VTERGGAGHEELRDELAAYALGALPPEEAAQLERHLADCESCRDRLRWLGPAVDMLGASVEQLTPPSELRERLMETVRAEAAPSPQPDAAASAKAQGRAWAGWGGWSRLLLRPATAFVAVVLIVAGVAAGYALRGDEDDRTTTIAAQAASPDFEGDVSAELVRRGDNGALHIQEMPPISRDEVYEVWVQRGDAVEPASTFVLNRDGSAVAAVPGLEDADAVLVTLEPYGGSEQPTTEPVLRASLN
jgi:anti-sigma-K factor RskA